MRKLPFFCPREECKRITGTIDDEYLKAYGICAECYVLLVEGREEPKIDVDFYKKRLEERGY